MNITTKDMNTVIITRDGKELKKFENQENSNIAFIWLLNHQSNSTHHAVKHEGYNVQVINQEGEEIENWKKE